jgi:ribosome-associated toxin RatA of RatAB toxin-antitoxin module
MSALPSRRFALLSTAALAGALLVSTFAAADTYAPPAGDTKAVELFKLGKDKKSNFEKAGSKFRVGRAEAFVSAPMKDVKAAILDYGAYSTIIPKFQKSKVLKREGESAEVYLQIPILKGAATIWAQEAFAKPVAEGKGEKIVGSYVKGNVDAIEATWHYRPVDAGHTIVTLDIYISPKISAPESLVTKEVEDACGDGVRAIRDKAEAASKKVAKNP